MFVTEKIPLVIQKAALQFDQDEDGNDRRVAELSLVIEPLPYELAAELDADLTGHLFTSDRLIRPELNKVTLNPRVGYQRVTVNLAEDMAAIATIQNAKIGDFTVTKRIDKHGREWLKAVLLVTIDLGEKKVREFLFFHFGTIRLFTFMPEQGDILSRIDPQKLADDMNANLPSGVESVTVSMGGRSATGKAH